MNFTDFSLNDGLQQGLADAGYISCMPVQEQVLQSGLEGADLYVQSQTGTGKTAAYLLILLQRLITDVSLSGKKALIMVPTRELAVQVEEEARILSSHTNLKTASFYGGVGYGRQQDLLKRGIDIIIGTPGRVIDLQESGSMNLSQVAFLVVDEADRMFDMGFYPDLRKLIKVLPKTGGRQTMLFSATLNSWVKNLAWEYTVDAKEITIEAENITVDEIEQQLYHVSSEEKMRLLLGIVKNENPDSVLVFCNTKKMSEIVSRRLKINGIESEFIIGDLPQSKRLQVINSFKSGSLKCLVATDVAARGIDVDALSMVINYDLPNEAENYVHRIGRTARAGKTGKAYSFCSEQDVYNLPAIERYIENKIPSAVATEELLADDKSAGMYIKTDRYDTDYDDEDPGYHGRGNRRRSTSRSSGGRGRSGYDRGSSGSSRRGSTGSGNRSRVPEGRYVPTKEASGSYQGGGRPSRRGNGSKPGRYNSQKSYNTSQEVQRSAEEPDLSRLTFEERMAYYKSKYGGMDNSGNNEGARTNTRNGKRASGNGDQNNKGNTGKRSNTGKNSNGKRQENPGKSRKQQTESARASQRSAAASKRSVPAAQNTRSPEAHTEPQKKSGGVGGLFKRLFGKKD